MRNRFAASGNGLDFNLGITAFCLDGIPLFDGVERALRPYGKRNDRKLKSELRRYTASFCADVADLEKPYSLHLVSTDFTLSVLLSSSEHAFATSTV